ncbi:MAG: GntR family transcriptional regulator [Clostridia bacterium]|nr:GntR family transcriptional regulator [Clostridia bacterium]
MLLKLDFQSDTPIYLQLKTQIIEGIATGKLSPGESLPSVRQLASDLGINLHTVNKTYTLLKQDGFLIIHRQKGVVVNPDQNAMIHDEYLFELHESLKPLIAEAFCRGMKKEEFNKICTEVFLEFEKSRGENR